MIIAPAHQHVADVAGDHAITGHHSAPDPVVAGTFGVLPRADLQPALTFLLEHHAQAVEVGMRTSAPEALVQIFLRHGQIVQQAQSALVIRLAPVMCDGEEVALKAQAFGEAGEHLHAQLPGAVLEIQHDALKFRHYRLVRP